MKFPAGVILILAVAGGVTGCAKAQAKTAPERVAMDVPPAPARVIAPVETPPADEAPAAPTPAPTTGARTPPPRPTRGPTTQRPEPPKPEPARPDPAAEARGRQAAQLRTPQTASDVEVERKIRDALTKAARDLDSVSLSALNPDGRAQYETARRFIQQAEEGLAAKNYVFAGSLADKAETIAAALLR